MGTKVFLLWTREIEEKNMKKILTIFLVCFVALSLVACSSEQGDDVVESTPTKESSSNKIDLNKYIIFKSTGYYSGAGRATVELDKEQFYLDNINDIRFKDETAEKAYYELTKSTKSAIDVFFSFIDKITITKGSALNNGDIVSLEWEIDEGKISNYFDIDFFYFNEKRTISGLKVPVEFNPMDYVSITYNGDYAYIKVDTSSVSDPELKEKISSACPEIWYSYDEWGVSADKTLEVTYYALDLYSLSEFIEEFGLVPTETSRVYKLDTKPQVNGGGAHSTTTTTTTTKILGGTTSSKPQENAKTYKITYDANGGSVKNNTQTVTYDSYYVLEYPTRKGYTFAGWYDGETRYYDGVRWKTSNNVTLKAKWTINRYRVSVRETSGGSVSGTGLNEYNSTVILSAKSLLGYTWLGWYDMNDNRISTDQTYSFTMGDTDVTLKAKWEISGDMSGFKFTSTETTCTITDVLDDSKSTYRIPEYVTSIGDWTFFMCDNLTSITIPSNVTSIGGQSFSGCRTLESVIIPKDVTSIGESAFSGCSKLTSITFQGGMANWNAIVLERNWNFMAPATKIVCSDGVVTIG